MSKLLMLEDEIEIGETLHMVLKREGYDVLWVTTGDEAVEAALTGEYSLMILDVMLKQGTINSGLEVARMVRSKIHLPYILLTSRSESYDIMLGLDSGAEDYITKPYDLSVLLARIRTVMRRAAAPPKEDTSVLCVRELCLNLVEHKASVDGEPVQLSNQLFEMLHFFMKNKKKVITKEELYKNIWGYEPGQGTETNNLEVNIKRLRHHIGAHYIKTVRGKGYVLE